ncbi:MAG: glycosyltransferase [Flavobacteriales bacterium]|nr:glycosyltransferase [Flavobacteriales bacterium]
MILYLTYNDQPSGVYWSQVTDVVDRLNALPGDHVRLVALVSLRSYFDSRKQILRRHPSAIILPMVPRQHNWKANWVWLWLLCKLLRPSGAICRGIFASALAIRMRDRGLLAQVCFDARAAYGAEWEEYRVVDDDKLVVESADLERQVVMGADLRMAVSHALVQHWKERFGYAATRHLVVPCTLGRSIEQAVPRQRNGMRAKLGWKQDDTVLVYSGSAVSWQSLELAERVVAPWLRIDPCHRILFLTTPHEVIDRLIGGFPGQVAREWVDHREVGSLLRDCDIGLLLREARITNRVASPTKFAEYLSAGLPVAISEAVGDFSDLVRDESLGQVLRDGDSLTMIKPDEAEVRRLMDFSQSRFSKDRFDVSYGLLKACMATEPELPADTPFNNAGDGPAVSIIVPSYNKKGFIRDMVHSVQAQTDGRWELLIIDDASTDGSADMLRGLAQQDPRITVVANAANQGANLCRNQGIAMARAPYIVFLDADDLLAPHCLARRLSVMQGSGNRFSVSTMQVFRLAPGDLKQRWVPLTRDPLGRFFRHDLPWQTMQPIWKTAFLREIGGFDPDFSRHQDVELHTRALLAGNGSFRLRLTAPDCYYRIDEERKVLQPMRLLKSFAESAVRYKDKFQQQAHSIGRSHLLLGIIHRTHLQVLLYRKLNRITDADLEELERILFAPAHGSKGYPRRWLFSISRWYNLLPLRVPGINLLITKLLMRRA